MATSKTGRVLAQGNWDTQSGSPATAPGPGKYRADVWAAPTLVAVAGIDADGYDRQAGLAAVQPGDLITEQASNDSQNYQRWTAQSVTDHGTWVSVTVEIAEQGSAFVPPGSNQRRLLQVLSMAAPAEPGPGLTWQMWAPPLDPPTPGGLPADWAQQVADACWATDPHLCAALQWEGYAAMLPPSPAVSNVSTGAQSVAYSPPMPGGDYGAAMSRAAWHRSLAASDSPELVNAMPGLWHIGAPWPGYGSAV